jgi:hypothetical protein
MNAGSGAARRIESGWRDRGGETRGSRHHELDELSGRVRVSSLRIVPDDVDTSTWQVLAPQHHDLDLRIGATKDELDVASHELRIEIDAACLRSAELHEDPDRFAAHHSSLACRSTRWLYGGSL